MRAAAWTALVLLACAGPAPDRENAARPVNELARSDVWRGAQHLGQLIEVEIDDPRGLLRFWRALNMDRQYLGYIDTQGRCFKRVPFRSDEEPLGIHTMESGLALLYEVDAPLAIHAVKSTSGAREASSQKR